MRMKQPLSALLTIVVAAAGWAGPAQAQERSAEELAALREKVARSAVPGPEHERLAGLEGEWTWEGEVRPAPGAEAVPASGAATAGTILEGRFLVVDAEREEGEVAPRESRIILGFDRRYEEYTLVGLDTWGTYWVTARGPWIEEREAIVLSGEDHDPLLGHTQLYDFVLSFPDPDTFVIEIVFKDPAHTGGDDPFTMVTTTYRRR